MSQSLFDATCQARDALYASFGQVDPDVIGHIINPAFMGGPSWPALRQAFSVVRRGSHTLVISNGLSDPFDDSEAPNAGFGIEIYAETQAPLAGSVTDSPVFKLVHAVAQQAAHSGQVAQFVKTHGVVTMELFADEMGLEDYQNEAGMVGVMIGVDHPEIPKTVEFPGGEVVLASVQLLTAEELHYVAQARAAGRKALHDKLKSSGQYHYLTPGRPSLVTAEALAALETAARSSAVAGSAPAPAPTAATGSATDGASRSQTKPWWKFW